VRDEPEKAVAMPTRRAIDDFLHQEHIAFVGVSRNPKEFANSVYRHLRGGGRTLLPVHREAGEIEGDRCWPSLAEVPDPVEGVVIMVPPATMAEVAGEAVARGIPRVWFHRGAGQKPVPAEAVEVCRAASVDVVDGACPFMFDEPVAGIHRLHRAFVGRRIAV
jgi:predicted CoA-binding protein